MDKTFLLNNILKSDGTNQSQRILPALVPESILIDERGIKDILDFTVQLAEHINFFKLDNTAEGDWRNIFQFVRNTGAAYTVDEIIGMLESQSDFHPEFALFVAFVQLFQFAQNDINAITGSHLDFYYKEVLSLPKKAAIPDKVNLILELAKNLVQHELDAGTKFKGGKDPKTGLVLTYASDSEIVVNKAQVTALKSVFIDAADNNTVWSSDAANSSDGKGKPFAVPGSRWSGFGETQTGKTDQERNMGEATIGFGFASPMLVLGEGQRTISLVIGFEDTTGDELTSGDISNGIEVYLSGEKAWIQPAIFTASILPDPSDPALNVLQMVINLSSVDPAVVPFSSALPGAVFETPWPVVKVVFGKGAFQYSNLYNLRVRSASINVSVNGVKNVVVQNSQSQLNPGKPFQPFGSQPTIHSAFYIGSSEVFSKRLSDFSVDIQWNEVPSAEMGEYYLPYLDGVTSLANTIFTTRVSLLYQDHWLQLKSTKNSAGDYFLFDMNDATVVNEIAITGPILQSALTGLPYSRNINLQQVPLDNTTHDGFISLEITGPNPAIQPSFTFKAFGHNEFPNIYAKRAIKMATNPDPSDVLPPPPYTPSVKSLSLNYTSGETANLSAPNSPEQFFHIEPFGAAKMDPANPYLLPQFRNEANLPQLKVNSPLYQGNFYLGISNLTPPQNLNILFQIADGSADTNVIVGDEDIQWSYMADNQWIPIIPLQILSNTTNGFQTSGIIAFTIGSDASSDNTLMPVGTHWLRGSLEKNPAGISRLIDVRAQAIEASYVLPDMDTSPDDAEKADGHLEVPLAVMSIKELLVKDAAIKSIQQPYESFDGSPREKDTIYYTRVSERLRHKKRALTIWDYERLILDAFPSIFKVKCLTHTDEQFDLTPGSVRAVVVPNLLNKNSTNPLQPTANLVTLNNIAGYVSQYTPVFVDFRVDNPVYEQLLVDFKVGFMPGKDPGYYGNLLNEEIKKFLSPWAYEEGQDITFGGKVYKSDIIVFIENRDYVDFVNDFRLYHIFDGVDNDGRGIGDMIIESTFIIWEFIPPGLEDMTIGLDFIVGDSTEVAVASGPRSILVSAPNHRVTVLKSGEYVCSGVDFTGIGYMTVGGDFIVA